MASLGTRRPCHVIARRSLGSCRTTATAPPSSASGTSRPTGNRVPPDPFDRWPNGWGFDYFYGILGGGASQWDPCLAENQKIIGTPDGYYDKDDPYYFPDAMADRTIEWLHAIRAQDADKPFFVYFSTGCSHAPHHVTKAVGRQIQGEVRPGLGPAARGDVRSPEGARGDPL